MPIPYDDLEEIDELTTHVDGLLANPDVDEENKKEVIRGYKLELEMARDGRIRFPKVVIVPTRHMLEEQYAQLARRKKGET